MPEPDEADGCRCGGRRPVWCRGAGNRRAGLRLHFCVEEVFGAGGHVEWCRQLLAGRGKPQRHDPHRRDPVHRQPAWTGPPGRSRCQSLYFDHVLQRRIRAHPRRHGVPGGDVWFVTNNTDGRGTPGPDDDRILSVEPDRQ